MSILPDEKLARGQQFLFYVHRVLTKMICIFPFLTTAYIHVKKDFSLSSYDSFFLSLTVKITLPLNKLKKKNLTETQTELTECQALFKAHYTYELIYLLNSSMR